jgi:hypothetical protein
VETIIGKRGVSTAPNAIGQSCFVSDVDPLKGYTVALFVIVDPRFWMIAANRDR